MTRSHPNAPRFIAPIGAGRVDIRPALHRAACLTAQRTADERRIARRGRRGLIVIAVLVGMAAGLVGFLVTR